MQALVKIIFFLQIFFLPPLSFGEDITHTAFDYKDFIVIKTAFENKNIVFKDNGNFIDFKTYQPSKSFLEEQVRKHGAEYIFPDKIIYDFFIQYLNEIYVSPQDYENKELVYSHGGIDYIFSFTQNKQTMTIRIIQRELIKEFGYSEQLFTYSFEKNDGMVVLSEINVAG